MVHIQTQKFYERETGNPHEVTVMFGGISIASRGTYDVVIDGKTSSRHGTKRRAFDEIVEIVKANNWTPANRH